MKTEWPLVPTIATPKDLLRYLSICLNTSLNSIRLTSLDSDWPRRYLNALQAFSVAQSPLVSVSHFCALPPREAIVCILTSYISIQP